MSTICKIVDPDTKSIYVGATKPGPDVKGKPSAIKHGHGCWIRYPYLNVGTFENDKQVSGRMYYKPNCGFGELYDFEKDRRGETDVDAVTNPANDPVQFGYVLLREGQF